MPFIDLYLTPGSPFPSRGHLLVCTAELLALLSHWDVLCTPKPSKQLLPCCHSQHLQGSLAITPDKPHAQLFVPRSLRVSLWASFEVSSLEMLLMWISLIANWLQTNIFFLFSFTTFLLLWLGEREASSLASAPAAGLTSAHTDSTVPQQQPQPKVTAARFTHLHRGF